MSKSAIDKVADYFKEDYNCCQSVLISLLEQQDALFEEAPFIGAGFGGGIIGRGEICGAVSGAIMAIGVLTGKTVKETVEHKEATKKIVSKFLEKFGATDCNDLLEIDENDPDARQKAADRGVFREKCPEFVKTAVQLVLELLQE
ncbi:MAG: hypothetical protein GF308_21085 [Candidatus Heimdallarchaeota archaeon]|nr:hypothetical protein [Candidatus Heimdallarchaeota archaeon]